MTVIIVVVGNPQPSSRTRLAGEEVAAQIAERSEASILPTIDLSDIADRIFTFPESEVDRIRDQVAAADVVIMASPTYKGAYTGLLKAFLDRYDSGGLSGVLAVPLMTIGSNAHALAVEHTLRPLLVELGASTPTRGIAFPAWEIENRSEVVAEWLKAEWPWIGPLLHR